MAYQLTLQDLADTEQTAPTATNQIKAASGNPSLPMRLLGDIGSGATQALFGIDKLIGNPPLDVKTGLPLTPPTNNQISQLFGVKNPNLADNLLQGAVSYAPYAAGGAELLPVKAAEKFPLLAKSIQQGFIGNRYGATQSSDPITGQIVGTLLGPAAELAPAATGVARSVIGKLTGAIQPQRFAEQLIQNLGGGNTLEGNAQSLAQDISNAYNNRVEQGSALYKPLFDALGNNSIYKGVNQAAVRQPVSNFNSINDVIEHVNDNTGTELENASDLKDYLMQNYGYAFPNNKSLLNFFNSKPVIVNKGNYNSLGQDIIDSYDRNLKDLHNQFTENPTLQNAHNLQSQLGYAARQLQAKDTKSGLSPAERSTLQGYQQAQNSLRSDINTFLNSNNPVLANQYNLATANWAQNVTPYLENPKIAQIAKGDITNPDAIANLFKNPEPEIQQIVNDIGPSANNKILYAELGKTKANLTPERLTNSFNQLENKGLSSYITPELAQQFEQLAGKTTARNYARLAAGTLLGSHFGGPLGAAAGAVAVPLMAGAMRRIPTLNLPLSAALLNASRAGYRPLTNSITANAVNAIGEQK